jgi:hypothetical protein
MNILRQFMKIYGYVAAGVWITLGIRFFSLGKTIPGIFFSVIGVALLTGLILAGKKKDNPEDTAKGDVGASSPITTLSAVTLGAGVMMIAGLSLSPTSPITQSKQIPASGLTALSDELSAATGLPVSPNLVNQVYYKPVNGTAPDGQKITAKVFFVDRDTDDPNGTYTLRVRSLDEKGQFIGPENPGTSYQSHFVVKDGRLVQNPIARSSLATQAAMATAANASQLDPTSRVVAAEIGGAQGHNAEYVSSNR